VEQIITAGGLPDGNVAVLCAWSDDARQCELEWNLTVSVLAAAGLEVDDAPSLTIGDSAELWVARRPRSIEEMESNLDEKFAKLLEAIYDGDYSEAVK